MRAIAIWLAVSLLAGLGAHLATVLAYPRWAMAAAMERMSQSGAGVNAWRHRPRVSERSRGVVRPSPDLAYSTCVFDLTAAPVAIAIDPWESYASLSLYGANTDNFYTLNDREMAGERARIIVRRAGQEVNEAERRSALAVIDSPSTRGVALLRRLAPTADAFMAAAAVRRGDRCFAIGAG